MRLSGPRPTNPPVIEANTLSHPDDMCTALACVNWSREIGNAAPLSPYVKREVMPGNLKGAELENFVRNAASTFHHQCGTTKMGHDEMSVVNGALEVHGIQNLRVADASIMPQITIGNIMAPCVVIGERAARLCVARVIRSSAGFASRIEPREPRPFAATRPPRCVAQNPSPRTRLSRPVFCVPSSSPATARRS